MTARGRKQGRAPSLRDVARKAGVSVASVSRVLNRVSPTSERLRRQVQAAAEELGYVPRSGPGAAPPRLLAVIVHDLRNPYFCEILTGVGERASALGLSPVIVDLRGSLAGWDAARAAAAAVGTCGFLFLGTGVEERGLAELAESTGLPVAAVNQSVRHPAVRTINVDYVKATYTAAQHLLGFGHRRFGFLGGSLSSAVSQDKVRGVRLALAEADLDLHPANVIHGPATVEWGFQALNALLARPRELRPTAVLCACDLIAFGVLHALRSAKLGVPQDMSVTGFDDIEMAFHANPPLTTISPPKYEMGRRAVELLLAGDLQSSPITEYVMIESPLVVRESTGSCRG